MVFLRRILIDRISASTKSYYLWIPELTAPIKIKHFRKELCANEGIPSAGKVHVNLFCGFPSHGFFHGNGITGRPWRTPSPGCRMLVFKSSRLVLGEGFYKEPKWNSKNECSQTSWRATFGSTSFASGFISGLSWIPFFFVFQFIPPSY